MANIGEETGPPWEEPAPNEWELPGQPTTEPAEPSTPEPVTVPAGTHPYWARPHETTWHYLGVTT